MKKGKKPARAEQPKRKPIGRMVVMWLLAVILIASLVLPAVAGLFL